MIVPTYGAGMVGIVENSIFNRFDFSSPQWLPVTDKSGNWEERIVIQ